VSAAATVDVDRDEDEDLEVFEDTDFKVF